MTGPPCQAASKATQDPAIIQQSQQNIREGNSPLQGVVVRRSTMLSPIQPAKSSRRDMSSIPLLQLPPEIRNQIWLDALDGVEGRFQQIRQGEDGHFGLTILDHNILQESCVTRTWKTLSLTRIAPKSDEDREVPFHTGHNWQAKEIFDGKNHAVSLDFLRTCRQIYEEAGGLLYSSQIFSFEHGSSFMDFMANLTPLHCSNLTSLHFKLESGLWAKSAGERIDTLLKFAIQSSGLQVLNVFVRKRSSACSELSSLLFLILSHTTARRSVTVILPRRGPYRYTPSVLPPKDQPHPLQVSKKSSATLKRLQSVYESESSTTDDELTPLDPRWECLEWPAERQLDFATSVIKRVSNPWAQLDPQNYIQDDRPPRFVLFNCIERAFWLN